MSTEQHLLSVDEVAEHLGMERRYVTRQIRLGYLEAFNFGNKYRVKPEALADFINEHRMEQK